MASEDRRRDPAPSGLTSEPEFKRLVELLRQGKVEPERLDAYLQQRQLSLFNTGESDGAGSSTN